MTDTWEHGEKDYLLFVAVEGKDIRFDVEAFAGSYDNPWQSASHAIPFDQARQLATWLLDVTKEQT